MLLLFLVSLSFRGYADSVLDSILNPKTRGNGYVSDAGALLQPETIRKADSLLAQLNLEKKAQVAVVLVSSIGHAVPKDIATQLFRRWRLGDEASNNGLLILLVKDQRRIEFEVGYGLEGILPDIITQRIQQEVMVPALKSGNYDAAVLEGLARIAATFTEYDQQVATASADRGHAGVEDQQDPRLIFVILLLVVYLIAVSFYAAFTPKKGMFKQSPLLLRLFIIFGPMLLVLLLASLSPVKINYLVVLLLIYLCWAVYYSYTIPARQRKSVRKTSVTSRTTRYLALRDATAGDYMYMLLFPFPVLAFRYLSVRKQLSAIRYAPYIADQCKGVMQLVKKDRNVLLSETEQLEEKMGGLAYDIWQCDQNDFVVKLAYTETGDKVCLCKQCKNYTAVRVKRTVELKASTRNTGYGYNEYVCRNCAAAFSEDFTLAKKLSGTFTTNNGGSSRSSSGNSSSGSGSSSSGGSWGGGSSGGAGSGSNW